MQNASINEVGCILHFDDNRLHKSIAKSISRQIPVIDSMGNLKFCKIHHFNKSRSIPFYFLQIFDQLEGLYYRRPTM